MRWLRPYADPRSAEHIQGLLDAKLEQLWRLRVANNPKEHARVKQQRQTAYGLLAALKNKPSYHD